MLVKLVRWLGSLNELAEDSCRKAFEYLLTFSSLKGPILLRKTLDSINSIFRDEHNN